MTHSIFEVAAPWAEIGANVKDGESVPSLLKRAGLGWSVEKHPLKADINGRLVNVPGRFALVRDSDDKVMTVAGQNWKPVQNKEILQFMQEFVKEGGINLEAIGHVRSGKIFWGLARINHEFTVGRGNDRVGGFLLITSPHDVGRSLRITTTSIRFRCANTLPLAERSGVLNYSQHHSKEFDVSSARLAVEAAHESLKNAAKRAKIIANLKLSVEDAVTKVLAPTLYPEWEIEGLDASIIMDPANQPKTLKELINSINSGPGATPGNGWGVLNGYTHWADHMAGRNASSRMFRSWFGDYARNKAKVEQALVELA